MSSPTKPGGRIRSGDVAESPVRIDLSVPRGATGPRHEVTVHDGRFTLATCSCGWHGIARRQRSAARTEARDHALLYAGTSESPV